MLAGALAAWPSPAGRAAARLRGLLESSGTTVECRGAVVESGGERGTHPPNRQGRDRWRRRVLAVSGGLAVGAVLGGGSAGLVAGAVVAFVADRLLGESADDVRVARATRRALEADLPAACELLGVCLDAGVPVSAALSGVGAALSGPLGGELSSVAALLRLGAEPRKAWSAVPPELGALGRVLTRAGESGSTVTPALRGLAVEGRAAERARTETAVRRAGVWVLAPLGLCFLPAFLCLGVVPLVLGIAGNVFR